MQTKLTIIATVVAVVLVGVVLFGGRGSGGGDTGGVAAVGSAVMEDGVQVVDITARAGYSPRVTKAKAGVPTVIRMNTNGTYDCSMALAIPDLDYQSYLKPTGVEEIQVTAEKAQGILRGMCSMAMYHFQVDFE